MDADRTHFRIASSREQGAVLVRMYGELDVASAVDLDRELDALMSGEPATIVLDLRELSFMDSTGLRAVLGGHQRAEAGGHRLVLVRGTDQVERLLRLTGIEERLPVVDHPDDLLAAG